MAKPFRSRSNPHPPDTGGIDAGGESLTRQEFKDECDINRIMKRALRTGVVPARSDTARYGDFSSVNDFQEAQAIILRAQQQFESMPAEVRDRFHNDPTQFLAFVGDSKNLSEARKLGLLKEEKAATPVVPDVTVTQIKTTPEGA